MSQLPPTPYELALRSVATADAPVVMNLTCHKCKRGRKLATVSRTSAGLLFRADVRAFDVWPQLADRSRSRFAPMGGGPTYKVAVLIDWPAPQPWSDRDGPRVTCAHHGTFTLSPHQLSTEARKVKRLGQTWSIQPFIVST